MPGQGVGDLNQQRPADQGGHAVMPVMLSTGQQALGRGVGAAPPRSLMPRLAGRLPT